MMDVKVGTGIVKWFNDKKGFGFITPDDNLSLGEVFVHFSTIKQESGHRQLYEKQRVVFHAEQGEKGLHATMVEVIDVSGKASSTLKRHTRLELENSAEMKLV